MRIWKIILTTLTFTLLASSTLAFTDIQLENKYYLAITSLEQAGVINGYEDGTFKSGKDVTRAEAIKMIFTAFNWQPQPPTEATFKDVPLDSWYAPYIYTAEDYYLIDSGEYFRPDEHITLVEFLKIMLKTYEPSTNFSKLEYDNTSSLLVSDTPENEWFTPFTKFMLNRQLLNIYNTNTINPSQTMTRGYSAEIIYRLLQSEKGAKFGKATFYGAALQGNYTASGEIFDYNLMTAAHKTLPLGTKVKVTNLANGKEIIVKINDRGPYGYGRVIDLSQGAFEQIASLSRGVIYVKYEIVE